MSDSGSLSTYGRVTSVKELGQIIRMKRRTLGLTQEHVAGLAGIGIRYLSDLERGKQTTEMGKALQVVNCLGLELFVKPRSGIKHGGRHA